MIRKQIARLTCAVFTGLLLLSPSTFAAVKVGQPAPDFSGTLTSGETVKLSDYRGKTVVLEWTNHDCPYVRKHYGAGNMQAQQLAATGDGVIWLSIISSAPGEQGYVEAAEADALTQQRKASPTGVILDPEGTIGQQYGARTTPHMYIIDPEGTLQYMGGIDSIPSSSPGDIQRATQYVPAALAQLAAGQAVSPSVTRPYGCSVKYR
ncbi:MAG: redoxin domain-containing protein [Gammaproteobacteria bacterium]